MKRTQICLTENQSSTLKEEAKQLGTSLAELIRRILDRYIGDKSG